MLYMWCVIDLQHGSKLVVQLYKELCFVTQGKQVLCGRPWSHFD